MERKSRHMKEKVNSGVRRPRSEEVVALIAGVGGAKLVSRMLPKPARRVGTAIAAPVITAVTYRAMDAFHDRQTVRGLK